MNNEEGKKILEYISKISKAYDDEEDDIEAWILLLEQYVLEKMEK